MEKLGSGSLFQYKICYSKIFPSACQGCEASNFNTKFVIAKYQKKMKVLKQKLYFNTKFVIAK